MILVTLKQVSQINAPHILAMAVEATTLASEFPTVP